MATRKRRPTDRANRTRGVKAGAARGRVRKNMDMDATKLQAAQAALGTKSETETVDRALDLVLGRARFDAALDRISERGGFQAYDAP
jgi:Arc/MetJ family transcription regulator